MAVIISGFLHHLLNVHDNIKDQMSYPFFDTSCVYYEALRSVMVDKEDKNAVLEKYGLTEYGFRKSIVAFQRYGLAGLITLGFKQITEEFPIDIERMIVVLKHARCFIPATKMVTILEGFNHSVSVSQMRRIYASYGWAQGTRSYQDIDFWSLNLKVITLSKTFIKPLAKRTFFHPEDKLQTLLEIYRTLGIRGITTRYDGSRVSFETHKKDFISLGLFGLIDKARSQFRNSKLGFSEEGLLILSKIQHPEKTESDYLKLLKSKGIEVGSTCITNIFTRWHVTQFQSKFIGDLKRFLEPDTTGNMSESSLHPFSLPHPSAPIRVDIGFASFIKKIATTPIPLANPGIFLFLPYLNRLRLFEKASFLMELDPPRGYSWFSLLLLNLARIFKGVSSISKACKTNEFSMPLMAGLVTMPCNDSLLNGLALISEDALLQLRQYLAQTAKHYKLVQGKRIAFDFKMRDFTGDDIKLKNIGKGPSPKRKICFPGFRPHIAWDVDTGAPISIEFRNGKARATTTLKKYISEILNKSLGGKCIEHIFLDSEYTAENICKFVVDKDNGLGADLTMCIKQNRKVKKKIQSFLDTNPDWLFYDDEHTYSKQSFEIPIQETNKHLKCVLKRKESTGALRCFGSTLKGLDSLGVMKEYSSRWTIENGIKDLCLNYFFDTVPGIDPHKINIHYFIVNLARILYEMFCKEYQHILNHDNSKKYIDTLRHEFIVGTNATFYRMNDECIIKWIDYYPKSKHAALETLFNKLNDDMKSGISFLGGMKIKFEMGPPKPENLKNNMKRRILEFC
jgi:hypothetical protein